MLKLSAAAIKIHVEMHAGATAMLIYSDFLEDRGTSSERLLPNIPPSVAE